MMHELLMQQAIALSMKARITAPPNPWVGCVITNNGEVVGEGYTQPPGGSHAEIKALDQAQGKAKGATVYVTLEPCAHFGRTPPCSEALIKAQVARIFIGLEDPDPNVCGQGIKQLRKAGIEVITGVAAHQIAESLRPYLHHRKTGRPYCVGKAAVSLDGRLAAADGTSQWISSPEARRETHILRAESQAIIIGSGTARADHPQLTVRDVLQTPINPPLRVVLDSTGIVPPEGPLFDTKTTPTLLVTTQECPQQVKERWRQFGVEVLVVAKSKDGVGIDLEELLKHLGKRGVLQALVEGGSTIFGSFFRSKLLHAFHLDVGACLLGNQGIPLVKIDKISTLSEAIKLKLNGVKILGDTVRLTLNLETTVSGLDRSEHADLF
ncbi:MAG: bifunctional diaminohydroxyphosphoribosylaminopyrimidine deaminase/5-amino-6-(5-phosphoribosylamino)uracil reductase RibD [Parachlamydiaceae bacterium]